jgi:hypothetical protein
MTLLPFNEDQVRALHILAIKGYRLTIVHRHADGQQLILAGRDISDARLIGAMDAHGGFGGELPDHKPMKVVVGAPPAEPTLREVAPW